VELVKKHAQKIRFVFVGVANTVLDFGLLFILVSLGLNGILANYISTGIAFVFSFFVNRSFTFKHKGGNLKKQFAVFLLVTMTGLWVIQPIIIILTNGLFAHTGWHPTVILFAGKILATCVSLIWNYTLYARFVFKKPPEGES